MRAAAAPRILQDIGRTIHDVRVRLGWSQRELARRSGVSQARISRIERGTLQDLRIGVIDRLFVALGVRYWVGTESPHIIRAPADQVHASCSAYTARRLLAHGLLVEREVEVGGDRSRGWIDLLAFQPHSRTLFVVEVKTEIHDIGAIERSLNWYQRESLRVVRRFGWHPGRVLSVLLVLDSRVNDHRIGLAPDVFRTAFPGRAKELRAILDGSGVGEGRFIAMIDPRSRRSVWLRATRSDGRRSAASYVDYIDAARQLERRSRVRRPSSSGVETDAVRASHLGETA
jgi:transcriptional regulator with XRE-family HTH domain